MTKNILDLNCGFLGYYYILATLPDVICFFSFQKKKSAVQLVQYGHNIHNNSGNLYLG